MGRSERFIWKDSDIHIDQGGHGMDKQPRIEYISSKDINPHILCNGGTPYTDYDGAHAYAECGEVATVYLVIWDGWEWLALDFCRVHGNLALIEERTA